MNKKKEIERLKERMEAMEELLNSRTLIQVYKDLREAPGYNPDNNPYTFSPFQWVPVSISHIINKLILYLKLNIEIIPLTQQDIIIKKIKLTK